MENRLLSALHGRERAALDAKLTEVSCRAGHIIHEPGDIVDYCYFPMGAAIASYHVMLESGSAIETALVGEEGALGGIVSEGNLPAFARACVMHGGRFKRIAVADLDAIRSEHPGIGSLFARYADCLIAQVFQSVACNAAHTIDQRASKWLVAAVERTRGDDITMTQEQLASMMGIGRSYVSRLIQRYKAAGLVATRRGGLKVLDRERVAARSCGCNNLVREHFETVLAGIYPPASDPLAAR